MIKKKKKHQKCLIVKGLATGFMEGNGDALYWHSDQIQNNRDEEEVEDARDIFINAALSVQ